MTLHGFNEESFICEPCRTEFESFDALAGHDCDRYRDTPPGHYVSDRAFERGDQLVTDGGLVRQPTGGDDALALAGVGDQAPPQCLDDRADCPGPDAPGDELPCLSCLAAGAGGDGR